MYLQKRICVNNLRIFHVMFIYIVKNKNYYLCSSNENKATTIAGLNSDSLLKKSMIKRACYNKHLDYY